MGRDEKVNWIMGKDENMKELWYELVVNGVACNHEFLLTFLWFVNIKHVHVFLCHLPHLGLFNT